MWPRNWFVDGTSAVFTSVKLIVRSCASSLPGAPGQVGQVLSLRTTRDVERDHLAFLSTADALTRALVRDRSCPTGRRLFGSTGVLTPEPEVRQRGLRLRRGHVRRWDRHYLRLSRRTIRTDQQQRDLRRRGRPRRRTRADEAATVPPRWVVVEVGPTVQSRPASGPLSRNGFDDAGLVLVGQQHRRARTTTGEDLHEVQAHLLARRLVTVGGVLAHRLGWRSRGQRGSRVGCSTGPAGPRGRAGRRPPPASPR